MTEKPHANSMEARKYERLAEDSWRQAEALPPDDPGRLMLQDRARYWKHRAGVAQRAADKRAAAKKEVDRRGQ